MKKCTKITKVSFSSILTLGLQTQNPFKCYEIEPPKCILNTTFPSASRIGELFSCVTDKMRSFSYTCSLYSASAGGHGAREGGPVTGQDLAPFPGSLHQDTPPHVHFPTLAHPWGTPDTIQTVSSVEF